MTKQPGWGYPAACPKCHPTFNRSPIPKKDRRFFRPGATHFNRAIGIYDIDKDRTVAYQCLECEHRWDT